MNEMVRHSAKALLRDAIKLNIQHRNTGRDQSRFSEERDLVVADLVAAGCPSNYQDYTYPSDLI